MSRRLDFTAYDSGGQLRLAVEAKRIFGKSEEWAAQWRNNFMKDAPSSFGGCSHMLVTPDRIFIWATGAPPEALPTHQFDARRHLGPYFQQAAIPVAEIEPRAFERLVSWWLRALTEVPASAGEEDVPAKELQSAGLLPILTGARIVQEDAA